MIFLEFLIFMIIGIGVALVFIGMSLIAPIIDYLVKWIKVLSTKKRLMKTKKLQYLFNQIVYSEKDFKKEIKRRFKKKRGD